MAPSQSTLRGNKKPSWEVAQYYQYLRDQPAILMDAPKKKPKDTPVPGGGVIGCITDDRQMHSDTRTYLTNMLRDAEPF